MCNREMIEIEIKNNLDDLKSHLKDLMIQNKIIEAENLKDELVIKNLEIDELVNRMVH